jgi:O-antigen ligase
LKRRAGSISSESDGSGYPGGQESPAGNIVLGALAVFYLLPQDGPITWTVKSALLAAFSVVLFSYSVFRAGGASANGAATIGKRGLGDRGRSVARMAWDNGLVMVTAAIFGWSALSLFWSLDPARSLIQSLILSGLAGTVLLGVIRVDPGRLAGVIIALSMIEAVTGTLDQTSRVSGTFVNANHYAALVASGYAVALTRMVSARGAARWWYGILQFILLAAAARSQSRAILVACPAVLASLALVRPRGFDRRILVIAAALAVVCLATPGGPAGRLVDQAEGREGFAWTRLGLWGASLRMVRAFPLTGVGPGAFGDSFPRFRSPDFAHYESDYAHSEPLQVLCELGIPGAGLLLWGLAAWWRSAFSPRASPGSRPGKHPAIHGLFNALVVLAVFGFTDFPAHVPVLLVIAVAGAMALNGRVPVREKSSSVGAPVRLALALVTAAFLFVIGLGATADIIHGQGAFLARAGDTVKARKCFRRVVKMEPWHASALIALAELDPADPGAGEMLAAAARIRPSWIAPVVTGFERCRLRGDGPGMRALLARAESLDPYGLEPALLRVRLLGSTGELAAAWSLLGSIERRWEGNLDVVVEKARLEMISGRKASAVRTLEHILKAIPGHVLAREWLGRM